MNDHMTSRLEFNLTPAMFYMFSQYAHSIKLFVTTTLQKVIK